MRLRTGLLAFCVVVAAGCARTPGQGAISEAGRVLPVVQSATPATLPIAASPARSGRFARLADRGELAAYPGNVQREDGAYTWHRADVSEAHALQSMADGHLRLTTPDGRLLDVRYDRHVEHPSGDWTWIGHLPGEEQAQTIITFGDRAVFGSIAQPGGAPPLRLTMRDGVSWLVETDPRKVASIVNSATRPTKPDYFVVPHGPSTTGGVARMAAAPAAVAAATASGPTVVDVLIGYTSGLVTRLGSVSAVNTRLNNLVDITNAAYANSQVNAKVRLVHTMQVSYPDNTTNDSTLKAMSGKTETGSVNSDPAFNALRAAREQYGADLVSLVRPFLTGTGDQGGCGLAWLIGGGLRGTQLPSGSDAYGYSVVGDGQDYDETDQKTYFCRDESFAHELGHNEGSAHDRATAQGTDGVLNNDDYGAFQYSFGYKTSSTNGNFYTVMAYGDTGQSSYRVFSNPRITFCGGRACGTTTYEDNARSLGQMIPIVAGFRAVSTPSGPNITWVVAGVGDFNNDGKADILWRNSKTGGNSIWLSGNVNTPLAIASVTNLAWKIVGVGDFNGDGRDDIFWRNASTGADAIWLSGNASTQQPATAVTNLRWFVAGVGDFDGDGRSDVLWRNASTGGNSIWRSGNSATPIAITTVSNLQWKVAAVADFDGDGRDDIVWRNTASGSDVIWRAGNSAATQTMTAVTSMAWFVAGAGDFSGDGVDDVLWRNGGNGANAIWKSANSAAQQATTAVTNTDWIVAGVGDFDADGRADILWRNTSTGADSIWKGANSGNVQSVASASDQPMH